MIEEVRHQEQILAMILRHDAQAGGLHFFTPNDFPQQLAYMNHPAGHVIRPHVHRPVERTVKDTQETLFVRKGKVKVDFYSKDQKFLESRVLESGDVILLASGGHSFTMLEPTEMIEVKQGPYVGEADKIRFG